MCNISRNFRIILKPYKWDDVGIVPYKKRQKRLISFLPLKNCPQEHSDYATGFFVYNIKNLIILPPASSSP